MGVAALVLGIISLLIGFIPVVGAIAFIPALIGLIFVPVSKDVSQKQCVRGALKLELSLTEANSVS